MRTRLVVLVLVLLVAVPASAARKQRWVGTVASVQGIVLRLTGNLRPLSPTLVVGSFKCKSNGPGRCISKRGSLSLFIDAGRFHAGITFQNGLQCVADGNGTPSALSGNYTCGVLDAGSFVLNRIR